MLRCTRTFHRRIQKLMVANRGEIACRVFRTCRKLGIRTVALFSEAERSAKHVRAADEAVCIGPPPATSSYLRGDDIVEMGRRLSVDAIHPGYGFLSENADFAEAVARADMTFIGPPPSAIRSMGSKSESKRIMEAAGVAVVPGYYGEDQSVGRLVREASRIGYPILIKAVAGGGGKGMRIVERESDLEMLLQGAQREAANFFKDDRVLLERYIAAPRHIECQVFFDAAGDGVFFFERDCSVQRRYQKVLEEAPAPHLTAEQRQHIGAVALKAAKAVGYVGAGTVEFILDTASGAFFFMEMNTRLQVEHPVTEEVCRIRGQPLDLVQLQIRTAMGEPLGFSQGDVTCGGACIEARVYAESPEKGFLPESGVLRCVTEPFLGLQGATKTRLETGYQQGDEVLIHYDPMIAKLVVWGEDRQAALRGLRRALDQYCIVGMGTNVDFLKRCCETKAFIEGGVTTNFIHENQDALLQPRALPVHALVLASLFDALGGARTLGDAFRLNARHEVVVPIAMGPEVLSVRVRCGTDRHSVDYEVGELAGTVKLGDVDQSAGGDGQVRMRAFFDDGMHYDALLIPGERSVSVTVKGEVFCVPLLPLRDGFGDASAQPDACTRIRSPMPGKVSRLLVQNGAQVRKGQVLMVLEAMKMEHPIKALREGIVTFSVEEGDIIRGDQPMCAVEGAA